VYLKNRLYNYFGYTDTGYDPCWYSTSAGDANRYLGPEFGDPTPWFLADAELSWRYYPRLMNRYAPDNTIVTHCVFHRRHFSTTDRKKMKDVVARLGGEAKVSEVSELDARLTSKDGSMSCSGWMHQRY
jgi:hypothetical protein